MVTQSLPSAAEAVAFIGAGQPACLTAAADLPAADYWLLATPDDALDGLAQHLATVRSDWRDKVVFHCSGATSAALLAPLAEAGALIASAHPVHSFADPQRSLTTFQETWCVMEGAPAATQALAALFSAIGARPFIASRCDKALYHASTVMASNLLVALLHQAENTLCEATGLSSSEARGLLAPLSRRTLENYLGGGAAAALTGPVARGDVQTIARHLEALTTHGASENDDRLHAYRSLSGAAVDIALQQAHTAVDTLQRIQDLLHER